MKPPFANFSNLSDDAKFLCVFVFQGKSPVVVFNLNNSFFGTDYDAAVAELETCGVISEFAQATPFTAAYDVHFDIGEAITWFVAQPKEYRDQISKRLCRRPADDRDIAKAVRCIDYCLDLISVKEHPSFSAAQILIDIENRLKSTLNEIVGPMPAAQATQLDRVHS